MKWAIARIERELMQVYVNYLENNYEFFLFPNNNYKPLGLMHYKLII